MKTFKSIQDIFQTELMNLVNRVLVVRCKKQYNDAYLRNKEWLLKGRSGWWPIAKHQSFKGVVVLLDSAEGDTIEIWAGSSVGPDSGKVDQDPSSGRWTLQVKGSFQFMGLMQAAGVKAFLDTTPGNLTTYIDRDQLLDPEVPQWLLPAAQRPRRGFDPELCGDRAVVTPGTYSMYREHGLIVNSLAKWLTEDEGYSNLDNALGWHDLHAFTLDGQPELFEVKTDVTNSDIYCALGQLQLYELEVGESRKTLVLPQEKNAEEAWHERLFRLNIQLITYRCHDEGYTFVRAVPRPTWHR
ncbi:hypothetical protein [Acidovorax temperans]|uniref:hypothetical protein n=1 Tax=Acidovorax temperans TaxID=80878 RepID=UPI000AF6AC47|nr:hypothetical protein [Acidovorax temperans]